MVCFHMSVVGGDHWHSVLWVVTAIHSSETAMLISFTFTFIFPSWWQCIAITSNYMRFRTNVIYHCRLGEDFMPVRAFVHILRKAAHLYCIVKKKGYKSFPQSIDSVTYISVQNCQFWYWSLVCNVVAQLSWVSIGYCLEKDFLLSEKRASDPEWITLTSEMRNLSFYW